MQFIARYWYLLLLFTASVTAYLWAKATGR
jgi:hypothetical protein